jgi:hypothetical protein
LTTTDPLWQPTLSYDETELRKMDSALVMADGTALGSRAGIRVGDPGFAVSLAGTTVNVSAGTATLHRSGQGVYRAQLAATSPGTLAAANASFSRIDLVYLRVWDTSIDASGLRQADTVLLTGTPSGSPVAPTPGATEIYIPLATITVPSTGGGGTGSATVSSAVRQVTVAPGGILPVSSSADIAANGSYVGQTRYNTVRACLEFWSGSAWVAAGDWTTYTPTWTSTGTAPTAGNGTFAGRYARLGKTVLLEMYVLFGSTSNAGTGEWRFSLPVAAASIGSGTRAWVGSAIGTNPSTAYWPGIAVVEGGASVLSIIGPTSAAGSTNARWGATVPYTWSNGHYLSLSVAYEGAT